MIKASLERILHIKRFLAHKFYTNWNKCIFFLNEAQVGKNFCAYDHMYLKVVPGAKLIIGDNVTISSGNFINVLGRNIQSCITVNKPSASIIIGNNSGMSSATLWANKSIRIGNNVKIGANTIIMDHDAHSIDPILRRSNKDQEGNIAKEVSIEDDVLIGANSIILKGVTIGKCSVIGAGSVVTKSIPEYSIAAGNPCKVIKQIKQ